MSFYPPNGINDEFWEESRVQILPFTFTFQQEINLFPFPSYHVLFWEQQHF